MRLIARTRPLGVAGLLLAVLAQHPTVAGRAGDVRVEAFELLNEGVSAYNRGLYDEAVDKLGRCAAIALNSFRAYYYYGLALSASRRYDDAVEMLEVALDLEPEDLQALVALGNAQLKLGDIDEARAGYARALKLRPAYAPALDGTARTYEAQANDDKALDYYRQTILSDKGYAPAYTHLGDLYMRNGRVREAVRLLEEAVTIRPDFAEGYNRLAVAYGRLEMHNEAVATIRKAIELDPSDPYHLQTLGWLQLGQGLLSAAEGSFRQALALDTRLPDSRIGLAQIARRRGDYELAVLEIAAALSIPDLETEMVDRLHAVREAVEAEELRVAELESRVAAGEAASEDYAELADILARRGLWGDAAEMLRRAPVSPDGEEWLAFLLLQDGKYREAYGIYSRLADSEGRTDLRLNAGIALALLGNDGAAAREYEAILQSDPGHATARLYLANAQLRMGRLDAAAKNYRTYLDAGGAKEPTERVRRILKQIAPDLLPPEDESIVPPADHLPPPPPPAEDDEETES
jgi:tetratricopeptide (TPR) repeat protein